MPSPHPTSPVPHSNDDRSASVRDSLDEDQFDRLAQLVADGQAPFPRDLSAPDTDRLYREVSRRRRRRLVQFIAHCLAVDIFQSAKQPVSESQNDD